jgi:hypothetical protein
VAVWTILIASLTVLGLCVASTDSYSLYRAEFFEKLTFPHLVKFPTLPHLHEPATCPYRGPDESSPWPSSFFKVHFNIIILSTSGYTKWSISFRFPQQNLVCPFPPYMPQAMSTSSSLIWLSQFKLTNITGTPSPSLEFWCNNENWIGHTSVRWFRIPDVAVSLRWLYWIVAMTASRQFSFFSHPPSHTPPPVPKLPCCYGTTENTQTATSTGGWTQHDH